MLRVILGLGLGGGLGSLMGYFGKCSSGACPLTANPWRGALFGALLGLLTALSFGAPRGVENAPVPAGRMVDLAGEADFKGLVEDAGGPVFVRFYTNWCGWCRKMSPGVRRLSEEFSGRIAFVEINAERFPALAGRFQVQGLPTSFVFRAGRPIETIVGYRAEPDLRELLSRYAPAGGGNKPPGPPASADAAGPAAAAGG